MTARVNMIVTLVALHERSETIATRPTKSKSTRHHIFPKGFSEDTILTLLWHQKDATTVRASRHLDVRSVFFANLSDFFRFGTRTLI